MSSHKPILLSILAILIIGLVWTVFTPEVDKTVDQSILQNNKTLSINSLLNRIETLEEDLFKEQIIRQQVELRLSELEQHLRNTVVKENTLHHSSDSESEPAHTDTVKSIVKPPTLQDKLLKSNIPLDTIERIQQRVGENRLARLQLRDQAVREDWIDSPEYFEKEQQLPGATGGLREEFGDQIFDQYLYASGRPNRVVVREVYTGSAAKIAGIEPADIILRYASEAIYSMGNLQQATTEGTSGEPVLIEIIRNDLLFTTSVPRGPLGISMTITRKEPE